MKLVPSLTPAFIFSVQLLAGTALCRTARLCKATSPVAALALHLLHKRPFRAKFSFARGHIQPRQQRTRQYWREKWQQTQQPRKTTQLQPEKKNLTGFCVCTSLNKTHCFFPKRKDTKDEILRTGLRLFIPPGATKPAALKPRFRVPYTSHTHGTPPQTSSSALLHRRGSRASYSAAPMPAEKREASESPAGDNGPARRPGELRSPGTAGTAATAARPSPVPGQRGRRREELREPPRRRRRRPWAPGPPPCSRGLWPPSLPVTAVTPLPWQRRAPGPLKGPRGRGAGGILWGILWGILSGILRGILRGSWEDPEEILRGILRGSLRGTLRGTLRGMGWPGRKSGLLTRD